MKCDLKEKLRSGISHTSGLSWRS